LTFVDPSALPVYRIRPPPYHPTTENGAMMSKKLTDAEIQALVGKLTGWERGDVGGKPGIRKTYKRKDFLDGLGFVTRVAVLAEQANHHPDVLLTWPRVTMMLTTHDAGGLTDKDFALAEKIETVA